MHSFRKRSTVNWVKPFLYAKPVGKSYRMVPLTHFTSLRACTLGV